MNLIIELALSFQLAVHTIP